MLVSVMHLVLFDCGPPMWDSNPMKQAEPCLPGFSATKETLVTNGEKRLIPNSVRFIETGGLLICVCKVHLSTRGTTLKVCICQK